jgi:hypothetical protein
MTTPAGAQSRPQHVAFEALGRGLDNQSGGPVQGYVDGRLTILRGRTTLLSLRAESDYDLELSVGRMGMILVLDFQQVPADDDGALEERAHGVDPHLLGERGIVRRD